MRISDWSSDVCSSDLSARVKIEGKRVVGSINLVGARFDDIVLPEYKETIDPGSPPIHLMSRSEEHTSELQSLMRISYAVFCLKKKRQAHTSYNTCYKLLY